MRKTPSVALFGRAIRRGAVAPLAVLLAFVAPVAAADPVLPTLSVSAVGEVTARPDVAVITTGVVAEGHTTTEALAGADKAAAALLAEARAAGVAEADVATSNFSLNPVWSSRPSSSGETSRITGYTVSNTFTIKVRRIADVGPLLERMVGRGSNQISGIAFEVSDAEARRDEARVAAVAAARKRAELLAAAADQRIVRVLSLTESSADHHPPVFAKAMSSAPGGSVPVEAGSRSIEAGVAMTFELAPRETK